MLQAVTSDFMRESTLCKQEQEEIKDWQFSFLSSEAELLAPTGVQESRDLGVRYAHRFPSLLGLPYTPQRYKFQHTYKPRTFNTARAIANGMFNRSDFNMAVNPASCDPLLRFYDCCDKFQKTVKHKALKEQAAFGRGPEMKAVINNVSNRLGLQDSLSLNDVLVLVGLCSFEHSILSTSPWCAAFYAEDIKVLEYYQDLKYYWGFGYGHSINYEQSCNLVKDLLAYLKDNSSTVTGMIRVGHDSSLMPFCARLGVFRDPTPLLANNMAEQSNRKWRSSIIASFGANIAFVEYQCGSESKVRVFHNEKPLALPMCPASGCPLSNILNSYLESFANSCDFQKTCEYDPHHICDGHVTHSGTCVPSIIG
ncbi:multiple inositol polyphosphate phosphatase 1-like [Liolophura sinensis]|uniref:multiple inositol polyphosphate phosphatase 1-like n=1 Tax=Liolophura sinensis TaxID=3198878 RepID=UPI0031597F61